MNKVATGQIGIIDSFRIIKADTEEFRKKQEQALKQRKQNKALFRKLRNGGLSSDQAHQAMQLMDIKKEEYMDQPDWYLEPKQVGHELPYYHGKRRF